MTISLDGFVQDASGDAGRLYPDLAGLRETEMLEESIATTGAVVMGRRAYEMAEGDFTGYEFQVPIFVLTHSAPVQPAKGENADLQFTFVTEGAASAIDQAKAAAGDRNVTVVGGASTGQQLLRAGLVDELQIGIVPLLLSDGLRMCDGLRGVDIELEQTRVLRTPTRTDLFYRVVTVPEMTGEANR